MSFCSEVIVLAYVYEPHLNYNKKRLNNLLYNFYFLIIDENGMSHPQFNLISSQFFGEDSKLPNRNDVISVCNSSSIFQTIDCNAERAHLNLNRR